MSSPAPFRLAHRPRKLLLFSGHMIDAPDRVHPRFPARLESVVAARIDDVLTQLAAGPMDTGLTQGAAGGDLLFAQACVRRGVTVQFLLPLPEPEFIETSILSAADGQAWKRRYLALQSSLACPPAVMPQVEGDPFEACNDWLLATACECGADELHLICLWDGNPGDGPGGTAHMVDSMRRTGGNVVWIDTRTL